jgi:hypothetical protein
MVCPLAGLNGAVHRNLGRWPLRQSPKLPALTLIDQRLEPMVCHRQPLHVVRLVFSARTQRAHMVNLMAWTRSTPQIGVGAGVVSLERKHFSSGALHSPYAWYRQQER